MGMAAVAKQERRLARTREGGVLVARRRVGAAPPTHTTVGHDSGGGAPFGLLKVGKVVPSTRTGLALVLRPGKLACPAEGSFKSLAAPHILRARNRTHAHGLSVGGVELLPINNDYPQNTTALRHVDT